MTTLELPEPKIKHKDRGIDAFYDTGQIYVEERLSGPDEERMIVLELSVTYHKAGVNYLTGQRNTTDYYGVTIHNWTRSPEGVMSITLMGGNNSLGIKKILNPSNRFSRKKLIEHFTEWRENVEGWMSLADDQAAALLSEDEFTLREKIMPYWNGERAGLKA